MRFAGDIHYTKKIEEGIGQIRVPGMILQPLVENAVSHGIREMAGEGRILLQAVKEEGGIRVSVRDNGVGMTREQIEEVFRKASGETGSDMLPAAENESDDISSKWEEEKQAAAKEQHVLPGDSTGIGLGNVIRRLGLFYNRNDLLAIHSEGRMMGTEVSILLPAVENGL